MFDWNVSTKQLKEVVSSTKKKTFFGNNRNTKPVTAEMIDTRRRAFLKYAFFGGVVFFAGKYITPFINMFRGDTIISEKTFQNFKVTEMGRQLKVTTDDGDELLIIDKESF